MDGYEIITTLSRGEGPIIKDLALQGDKQAMNILACYSEWYECPKNKFAKEMFEIAYEEYKFNKNQFVKSM